MFYISHHTQLFECIKWLLKQNDTKPQKTKIILPNHQLCASLIDELPIFMSHTQSKDAYGLPSVSAFYALDFHTYSEKKSNALNERQPTSFLEERLLLTNIIRKQPSIQTHLSFAQAFTLSKDLLLFWYDSQKNNNFNQLLQEQRVIERAEYKTIICEFLEEVFYLFDASLAERLSIAEQYRINLTLQERWLDEDKKRFLIIGGILPTNKLLLNFFTSLTNKYHAQAQIILPPLLDITALNIADDELNKDKDISSFQSMNHARDYTQNSYQNLMHAMLALLKTFQVIGPLIPWRANMNPQDEDKWRNNFFCKAKDSDITLKYFTCQTVACQGSKIAQIVEELRLQSCNRIAILIKNNLAKSGYLSRLILTKQYNIFDLSLNTLTHHHQYNVLIHLSHLVSEVYFNLSRFIKLICNPSINKEYAQSFLLFVNQNHLLVVQDINKLIEHIVSSFEIPIEYHHHITIDLQNLHLLLCKPRESFAQILQVMLEIADIVFGIKWSEDFIEVIEQIRVSFTASTDDAQNQKIEGKEFVYFISELLKEQDSYKPSLHPSCSLEQKECSIFIMNLEQLLFNSYDAIIIPDFSDAVWNFNDDQGFWLHQSLTQGNKLLQSYFLSVIMNHPKLFLTRPLRDEDSQATHPSRYLLLMSSALEAESDVCLG